MVSIVEEVNDQGQTMAAVEEEADGPADAVDPNVEFTDELAFFHHIEGKIRLLKEEHHVVGSDDAFLVKASADGKFSAPQYYSNIKMSITLGKTPTTHGITMHFNTGDIGPKYLSLWKFPGDAYALSITMVCDGEEDEVKKKYDVRHVRFLSDQLAVFLRDHEGFNKKLTKLISKNDEKAAGFAILKEVLQKAGSGPDKEHPFFKKASQIKSFMVATDAQEAPTSVPPRPPQTEEQKAASKRKREEKKERKENGGKLVKKDHGSTNGGGVQQTLAALFGAGPSGANGESSGGPGLSLMSPQGLQTVLKENAAEASKAAVATEQLRKSNAALLEQVEMNKELREQVARLQGGSPPQKARSGKKRQ